MQDFDEELKHEIGSIEMPFGKHSGRELRSVPLRYLDETVSVMQPTWFVRRVCDYLDLASRHPMVALMAQGSAKFTNQTMEEAENEWEKIHQSDATGWVYRGRSFDCEDFVVFLQVLDAHEIKYWAFPSTLKTASGYCPSVMLFGLDFDFEGDFDEVFEGGPSNFNASMKIVHFAAERPSPDDYERVLVEAKEVFYRLHNDSVMDMLLGGMVNCNFEIWVGGYTPAEHLLISWKGFDNPLTVREWRPGWGHLFEGVDVEAEFNGGADGITPPYPK